MSKHLDSRIREVFGSLGGRASIDEVAHAVLVSLGREERDGFLCDYIKTRSRNALRSKTDSGLAFAHSIAGEYVALPLMDEGEYRYVTREHLKRAGEHYAIAVRYVDHCRDHLSVDISDELFRRSA